MTSALNKFNNLTQRVLAGTLGAAVLLGSAYLGEWSYYIVYLTICILTQLEFYKLVGMDGYIPLKTFGTISGVFIFTLVFLIQRGTLTENYYFLIFPLVSGIYLIKLYKKSDLQPFVNIAITFLGILYIVIPFSLFHLAAFSKGTYNYHFINGIMLILWASDTGAYFAGSKFGKRKLFARISPKKSWEGSFGGAVLAITMAWLLAPHFDSIYPIEWMIITVIIVISGTYGDLVESLFKRSISIKDSGKSIPGHGGFLDRFDSLLIALPFIVAYLKIFH